MTFNLINKIWVDMMLTQIKLRKDKAEGLHFSFLLMSTLMGLNFGAFLAILFLFVDFNVFKAFKLMIDFLPGETLRNLITGIVFLFVPSFSINYVFFIRNKKFQNLLEKYEGENGKLARNYTYFSILLIFLVGILNVYTS